MRALYFAFLYGAATAASAAGPCAGASAHLPFCNTSLSFEARAADLIARIPVAEKLALLSTDSGGVKELGILPFQWWSEGLHGVRCGHGIDCSGGQTTTVGTTSATTRTTRPRAITTPPTRAARPPPTLPPASCARHTWTPWQRRCAPAPTPMRTTAAALRSPTVQGRKLESYYVQPLCSPTRTTIMTGRYAAHTGIGPDVLVENVSDTGRPARALQPLTKCLHHPGAVRRARARGLPSRVPTEGRIPDARRRQMVPATPPPPHRQALSCCFLCHQAYGQV